MPLPLTTPRLRTFTFRWPISSSSRRRVSSKRLSFPLARPMRTTSLTTTVRFWTQTTTSLTTTKVAVRSPVLGLLGGPRRYWPLDFWCYTFWPLRALPPIRFAPRSPERARRRLMYRNQRLQCVTSLTVFLTVTLAFGNAARAGSQYKVLYSFKGGADGGGVFA